VLTIVVSLFLPTDTEVRTLSERKPASKQAAVQPALSGADGD
jgi:hypothetical protein